MTDPLLVLGVPSVVTTAAALVTIYRHVGSLQKERRDQLYANAVREMFLGWEQSSIEDTNIDPIDKKTRSYFHTACQYVASMKRDVFATGIRMVDEVLERSISQDIITIGGPVSRVLARISLGYDEEGKLDESLAPRFIFAAGDSSKKARTVIESYDYGKTISRVYCNAVADRETGDLFRPKCKDDELLETDYALLTVRPNPFDDRYRHWLLAGTNGVGGVALARALHSKKFTIDLWRRTEGSRYFQAVLETRVKWLSYGGYKPIGEPKIKHLESIPPGCLSPQMASERFHKMTAGSTEEQRNMSAHYDVVLSFAGPDRDVAWQLAELLRNEGFRVFYDEYEQHLLWGKDLYTHLSDVYKNKAKFCVMFISKAYSERLWTNHERMAAQARSFRESREYILPIRLDDSEIPGVHETVGYLDLRQLQIHDVFQALKKKLLDLDAQTKAAGTSQGGVP